MTTPIGSIGFNNDSANVGNFGRPVHLACPKDFTLTPVHKLEPMGFDMTMVPRDMHITSEKE